MVVFAGYDYPITGIVTIGSLSFDISKVDYFPNGMPENEGELARLYLSIMPHPKYTRTGMDGQPITVPAKEGIDLATATFEEIITYLNNSVKKSDSMKSLCRRVLRVKSEKKFNQEKSNISSRLKKEYDLIAARTRFDVDFLGECGFNNTVHLDKTLNHKRRNLRVG